MAAEKLGGEELYLLVISSSSNPLKSTILFFYNTSRSSFPLEPGNMSTLPPPRNSSSPLPAAAPGPPSQPNKPKSKLPPPNHRKLSRLPIRNSPLSPCASHSFLLHQYPGPEANPQSQNTKSANDPSSTLPSPPRAPAPPQKRSYICRTAHPL